MNPLNSESQVSEADHIVAFFTVQNALDHLRSKVDYKNGQAAIEAFSVLAQDKSNVIEERDNLRAALKGIGRKLDLARLTERYEKDEGFASFIDDLITDMMEGAERAQT